MARCGFLVKGSVQGTNFWPREGVSGFDSDCTLAVGIDREGGREEG
jgi:hypothetical protein